MSALNVVCLISGGKDSLFSILHCMKNGHKIIALANLHPPSKGPEDAIDDLDSYMYQTIGHAIIPLYEQALGLPLYRQEILGSAVNQDKCYGPQDEDDETEALVPLLRLVKEHHPEVNAVSTGAILSDYQRTRVESVALRLGLTPLSFLWQYPNLPPHGQASLLEHMAAVGQDSRLVKVASGGLDETFLWQNVADPRTIARLQMATSRFGSLDDGAVLGEGGEYETLAIAGPSCLWKGRIDVRESDVKVVTGEAGSAAIRIANAGVATDEAVPGSLERLEIPGLLEPQFQSILNTLKVRAQKTNDICIRQPASTESNSLFGQHQSIAERQHIHFFPDLTGEGSTAPEQIRSIMQQVQTKLQHSNCTANDVAYTTIILRDMSEFSAINAVYSTFFLHPNPPARATIACADILPPGKDVMLSMTVAQPSASKSRNGLHVQSRSYWAPANIGPYSQAISVPLNSDGSGNGSAIVYIAGQIPLIPASMELAGLGMSDEKDAFSLQTVLGLQHAVRVGRATHVEQWASAIAFITASSTGIAKSRAMLARKAWEVLHLRHDEDDVDAEQAEFDVWDLKFGNAQRTLGRHPGGQERSTGTMQVPSLHVVLVDALPRGAGIEWVVYGLTKEGVSADIPQSDHFLSLFRDKVISTP